MQRRLVGFSSANPAHNGTAWLTRATSLIGTSTAIACLLGLPAIAEASPVSQSSFTPPAGVSEYRLMFVTADSTSGASGTISDYNNFATSEAALDANLPSTVWMAVVSTSGTSAASNIACTPDCSNIPIFLVDGTEVAVSSAALFDTASVTLLNGIDEDQNGNVVSGYVWTGSNSDGTPAVGDTMGTDEPEFGFAGSQSSTAFTFDATGSDNDLSIYAISGVIDAPEPFSASLLGVAGIATGLASRIRRRRKGAAAG